MVQTMRHDTTDTNNFLLSFYACFEKTIVMLLILQLN